MRKSEVEAEKRNKKRLLFKICFSLQELLGPTWKDFTAVLLTHADKAEEAGYSEEEYLHRASSTLLSLLGLVHHKYIFLNNQRSIIKEERATVLRKLLRFIRQNNNQVLLLNHKK